MRPDGRRALRTAFLAALRAMAGPTLPLPPARSLRCCAACGRDRILVLEQSHRGDGRGLLRLRCGECGAAREVVATRAEAESLLASHAAQRQALADELASLDPDRMSQELSALLATHPRPLSTEPEEPR